MNSDLKIIVCCHKKDPNIREGECYIPLHVGKALASKDLGFQGDDTGENISHKNKNYCELTGLYWAWKNLKCTYVGLAHYRRYLRVDLSKVETYLSKYDIILPRLVILDMSAADKLMHLTTRDDFYIMLMSLLKLHPEYKQTVINQFFNSNRCSCFNMFICRKELCDDYCEWLFSIFDDMEKHVRLSGYSRLARLYGFLSEQLLLVYCKQKKLRIKYVDFDFYDDSVLKRVPMRNPMERLKRLANIVRHDIAFPLNNIRRKSIPLNPTTITGFKMDHIPYIDEQGVVHGE